MSSARQWVAVHRKAILGAALAAASSVCPYLWPQDPWLLTVISTVAVGLGVSYVPNRVRALPTESGTAPPG